MNQPDLVTLVDEQDAVIGSMDKIEAHRGKGTLHRAVSVFLFRQNPETHELELLVQQRSDTKIVGAGQWANTVCGNVWPEESYEACARRRLAFELGITEQTTLIDVHTFRYQVQCNDAFSENEIDHIFVGWYDGEVKPNPDEVRAVKWMSWEAARSIADDDQSYAPWFRMILEKEETVIAATIKEAV